jgi:hypothetical protein
MDYDLESAEGAVEKTLRDEIRPRPLSADRNETDTRAIA